MKKFYLVFLLGPMVAFGQKNAGIVLNKGRKITAMSSSSIDVDMGMGMQIKNSTTSTNILVVISDNDKNYIVSNTLTKVNSSMNAMGQESAYDSEKPADKDSELGKAFSDQLNKADTLSVDKISGDVSKKSNSPERPEKIDDSNPLAGMMSSMGGELNTNTVVDGAFFILPQGKTSGSRWTDSTTQKNIKTIKNYAIKSIGKNIAVIQTDGSVTGHGETEMQGSSIPFDMNTKTTGEMIVDLTTGLVSKLTSNAEVTMSMDVMGQTMPATSKVNSTITFQ